MTYLEEYLNEHKTNMQGFFTAQEDYDALLNYTINITD